MATNRSGEIYTEESPIDNDPLVFHALAEIKAKYYSDNDSIVSVDNARRSAHVIGRNDFTSNLSAGSTLMVVPDATIKNEVYLSSNGIDSISSADALDNEIIQVVGCTESAGLFTLVEQTVVLNGQTKVTLGTPLARVDKIKNVGTTDLVGPVYVYEDSAITAGVPDDLTKIHIMTKAGENVSKKATFTVPDGEFLLINKIYTGLANQTDDTVYAQLMVREPGEVFVAVEHIVSGDGSTDNLPFGTYYIVPPNSDVKIQVNSVANDGDAIGGFYGLIAKVI